MAVNYRKKRLRAVLIGVAIAVVILTVTVGKELLGLITGPKLPGYAVAPPPGSFAALSWEALHGGAWDYPKKPAVPSAVTALAGQPVRLHGFLLPLHEAGEASQFFIAEKPRGCYFCSPPGVSEVAMVSVAGGKALTPTDWPVTVYGTLRVATGAEGDEVLYALDDAVISTGRRQ